MPISHRIPHIGQILQVISSKLFLDVVLSSPADVTRALRGCFRGGFVYVSLRFSSERRKTSNALHWGCLKEVKELLHWLHFNTFL